MHIRTRRCDEGDFQIILAIINDAANAYRGVIPSDLWKEPYMTEGMLKRELANGVRFWGAENDDNGALLGVMGVQDVADVTLIRHAYVRTAHQRHGIGGQLLATLRRLCPTGRALLVGTWADAEWAIGFYGHHGFEQAPEVEKKRLLKRYWTIPERQIETSVVLVDALRVPK